MDLLQKTRKIEFNN